MCCLEGDESRAQESSEKHDGCADHSGSSAVTRNVNTRHGSTDGLRRNSGSSGRGDGGSGGDDQTTKRDEDRGTRKVWYETYVELLAAEDSAELLGAGARASNSGFTQEVSEPAFTSICKV